MGIHKQRWISEHPRALRRGVQSEGNTVHLTEPNWIPTDRTVILPGLSLSFLALIHPTTAASRSLFRVSNATLEVQMAKQDSALSFIRILMTTSSPNSLAGYGNNFKFTDFNFSLLKQMLSKIYSPPPPFSTSKYMSLKISVLFRQ